MPETTKQTAFRLTDEDLDRLDRIRRATNAKDRTEALRIAIEVAPFGLYVKLTEDMKAFSQKLRDIAKEVDEAEKARTRQVAETLMPTTPEPIQNLRIDQLKAYAASKPSPVRDAAQTELLRRGYFPDGLGDWVESHPELTIRVPSAIRRPPRR